MFRYEEAGESDYLGYDVYFEYKLSKSGIGPSEDLGSRTLGGGVIELSCLNVGK